MRVIRGLLVILVALAIIAAAIYLLRLPLAGIALRSGLASAGFENPQGDVVALTPGSIRVANLSAGPNGAEGIVIESLDVTFGMGALLSERRVQNIHASQGTVRVKVGADGALTVAGKLLGGGAANNNNALPFDAIEIADLNLVIDTPEGMANGAVSAVFTADNGGAANLRLETDRAGVPAMLAEQGVLSTEIVFASDGALTGEGTFNGDILTSQGTVRDINASWSANGASWRDAIENNLAALSGEGRIAIENARAAASDIPVLAQLSEQQSALVFGQPMSSLALSGQARTSLDNGQVTIWIDGAPLTLRADTGAELTVTPKENAPLIQHGEAGSAIAAGFDVSGAAVELEGDIDAEKTGDRWAFAAPIEVGGYRAEAVSIDQGSAFIEGALMGDLITADITTNSAIEKITIGRLSILDAPIHATFRLEADRARGQAVITTSPDQCLVIARAGLLISQQNMEASLTDATLCASDKPLAIVSWADRLRSDFTGVLTAASARYRLGRTRINGRPPKIDFSGNYQPSINETEIAGRISGGVMTINELLNFDAVEGQFDFSLNASTMRSTAHATSIRITQTEESPKIAPVMASGDLDLESESVTFDYILSTPRGERLGGGEGVHNVRTASGSSIFNFDRLEFTRRGLQPDRLAPVLKGFIGDTEGFATGSSEFSWSPAGIVSGANLSFEDVTFGGPTRVVTETLGLNGNIQFANLWPLTTDGLQTITVEGVDLDALQLERGEINFELPGDETLLVDEAIFPWFDGVLGVYKANAAMAGGEATSPLRADNIDLAAMLAYVNVDGLSGEGRLSGVLPLVVEDGKARIENGVLRSDGRGAIRYVGQAANEAAAAGGDQTQVAFDILRDLRYNSLGVTINGPLDGRLEFQIRFEGTGEVAVNQQNVRVPVIYRINLDAALLELLNQANLSRNIELQIQQALDGEE